MTTNNAWDLKDPMSQQLLSNGRRVNDILLKTLAIHCATIITVGHLTSLKQTPRYAQSVPVVAFVFAPMYPLAELVMDIYRSLRVYLLERENRGGIQYHLAACLGMRATPVQGQSHDGVRLLDLSSDRFLLRKSTKPRGMLWAARIGVLVTFLVQDSSVISLYFRRLRVINPQNDRIHRLLQHADADFDNVNALFAVGSFFAASVSLLLEISNWTWTYSPLGLRERAVPSEMEWYEVFRVGTSHLPEIVLTQLLMTCASSPMLLRNLKFGALFIVDRAGEDQEALEALLSFPFMLAILSVILTGLAICPQQWIHHLHIQPRVVTGVLYITAMAGLVYIRFQGVVGSCQDLAAVRACSRMDASWCMIPFLWRDPREGSLWAF